jgi:hypothetical protein
MRPAKFNAFNSKLTIVIARRKQNSSTRLGDVQKPFLPVTRH